MAILQDLKTLYSLTLAPIKGSTHAQRLESFYRRQSDTYDGFRKRLLSGREELVELLDFPEKGVWVDFGAGTGANLGFASEKVNRLQAVWLVDLAPSLLKVAEKRAKQLNWSHVHVAEEDAASFSASGPADVITFSYSLTMMPNWFAAVDRAYELLKPGGRIAVVDFYVSAKYAPADKKHSWFQRTIWPVWFGIDNVFLGPDHLSYLQHRFKCLLLNERQASLPYLPGKVPYYQFIGQKPLGRPGLV